MKPRFLGNLRIADLTSPGILGVTVVVRFVWNMGDVYVRVMTTQDSRTMTRHEARLCWKQFRKAGYKPSNDTMYTPTGDFIPTDPSKRSAVIPDTEGSKLFSDAEKIEEEGLLRIQKANEKQRKLAKEDAEKIAEEKSYGFIRENYDIEELVDGDGMGREIS